MQTLIEVGNWLLQKAGKETDKTVPIRLIANKLIVDKENQEIVAQAFNKATVDSFLKTGIIDWHHQSVMGKTPAIRAQAILGKPTGFEWENGLPAVYADLTKAHPIVRDSILPHLEADQPVFEASVGGSILKAHKVVDPVTKRPIKEQVTNILWNHLAIAAAPYVMCPGSQVSMVKATGDVMIQFSDLSAFEDDYVLIGSGAELKKALVMGSGTDSASLQGVDALRNQSLEGAQDEEEFLNLVNAVVIGIRNNRIAPSVPGVLTWLNSKGLTGLQAKNFMGKFIPAIEQIIGGH